MNVADSFLPLVDGEDLELSLHNGLFRDMLLLSSEPSDFEHPIDFENVTKKTEDGINGSVISYGGLETEPVLISQGGTCSNDQ